MKLNRDELRGTKSVFEFTLKQYAKSKANRIILIIMMIAALVSVPALSIIMGGSAADTGSSSAISKVYIDNSTEYKIDTDKLGAEEGWGNTEFINSRNSSQELSDSDVLVSISLDQKNGSYLIETKVSEGTKLSDSELSSLGGIIIKCFNEARYRAIGATDQQLLVAMSGFNVKTMSMNEYKEKDNGPNMETLFVVQYAYAIVVFLLCTFSTLFIIRAIIQEKDSKLVELLMVSVKPLALIAGKILAVMAYIFITAFMILAAFAASYLAGGLITGTDEINGLVEGLGLTSSFMNISPMTIIIVLVSLALGYLTLSIIGGIAGTCCSSMEDVESANMTVMMVAMFGYFVSVFATPFSSAGGSLALAVIVSLVPVVSIFCAPVQYICSNISIYLLLLSWLIQAGMIVLLSVFCSRVYAGLIIHKGNRVKLKELVSMAGLKKGKGGVEA